MKYFNLRKKVELFVVVQKVMQQLKKWD